MRYLNGSYLIMSTRGDSVNEHIMLQHQNMFLNRICNPNQPLQAPRLMSSCTAQGIQVNADTCLLVVHEHCLIAKRDTVPHI